MSDEELLAHLRNSKGWPTLGKAAADRIEALLNLNKALERAMSNLQKYTDEDLLRELVRRNGIQDAPTSRTMHTHEVLLGIGKGNHCYITFTDLTDVTALMGESHE